MSGKPALIRQSDVTRIVKGAKAAGINLGIVVKNGEVQFLPVDDIKTKEAPSGIERFRNERRASKASGHS